MENKKRLIDAKPIVQFIMDGLNNPDKMKALGHDAIEILAEIEFAPTVDAVEVVHGRWDDTGRFIFPDGSIAVRCTECGCALNMGEFEKYYWNYCPNCGAKMDGDGDGNL